MMLATKILACFLGVLVVTVQGRRPYRCPNGQTIPRKSSPVFYSLCRVLQLSDDIDGLTADFQGQIDDLVAITTDLMADCETPPSIDNAMMDYVATCVGSTVFYECDPAHTPSGTPFTQCLKGGTWATPDFACTPICPTTYVLDLDVGLCYRLEATNTNYDTALAACQADDPNARLINLDNRAKWDAIQAYLLANDPDAANYCAWVGMQREGERYFWQGMDSGDYIQMWKSGEPDLGDAAQTCTVISAAGLSDFACTTVNVHYVCEVPLD